MNTSTSPTSSTSGESRVAARDARRLERLNSASAVSGGRADGEALGDGGGGVAERVERVGDLADFGSRLRHLGDAAGVVGDRAVGVDGDDDAGGREHADRGDRDAVDAESSAASARAPAVGDAMASDDEDDRARRRRSCRRDAARMVVAGPVSAGVGDLLDRAVWSEV